MRVLLAAVQCEKGDLPRNLARHLEELVGSTAAVGVGAIFGLAERREEGFFITQAYAASGELFGVQRKRHLGEDEEAYTASVETAVFEFGSARFGSVICAEAGVDFTWDDSVAGGAQVVFMSSAPGLYGRRLAEADWQEGLRWWESCGLADARRHAARLGVWVAMATQAGSTVDEDFRGIAALIDPHGNVVERLPDWRPGHLVVDVPVTIDVDPEVVTSLHEEGIRDMRWWSLEEIEAEQIRTGPRNLADLLRRVQDGRLPDPTTDLGS